MPKQPYVIPQQSVIPFSPIPLLILPPQIDNLRQSQEKRYDKRTNANGMTKRILRCILREIDEGPYEGRAIGDGYNNANTHGSHIMRREIV